jgi:hypothetical protein
MKDDASGCLLHCVAKDYGLCGGAVFDIDLSTSMTGFSMQLPQKTAFMMTSQIWRKIDSTLLPR